MYVCTLWPREGDGGGGAPHIKKTGVLVVPFKGKESGFGTCQGVQPQKVHSGGRKNTPGNIWNSTNFYFCLRIGTS